jgi:ABC-type uncharacterized transport system ATPase subunit
MTQQPHSSVPPVLELKAITKRFPGVLANDHIDLTLREGEIHALLGENGAGKTTLMNVLYGLYEPDEGEIWVRGERVDIDSPNDAIRLGIGMVHQHFMLIPPLSVTENVMLGIEETRGRMFLDREKAAERVRTISERYGLEVDPHAKVADLSVGVRQRVEIIKVLYRHADILILDEPTAVLTPQEADELFEVMESLVQQGNSIIFITHKLKEVMAVADRITVLRDGKVVDTVLPEEATEGSLAAMMVGREVSLVAEKPPARPGEPVLVVENLHVLSDQDTPAVQGVSFEVHAGEILGIAGVQGNGQTELVEAITGLRESMAGEIRILDEDVTNAPPRRITELGVGHIPEDRTQDGLVLSYPIVNNLVLNTYYKRPFARGIQLNEDAMVRNAAELVEQFDVRTPSVWVEAANLSGGNQQKVIVAREFSRPISLLIAAQPTRGLDVGSIEYIHGRILEKRDDGCAVLLVSSELDEIMALADRIVVMYRGRIVDVLSAAEATREEIGLGMAGITRDAERVEPEPVREVKVAS